MRIIDRVVQILIVVAASLAAVIAYDRFTFDGRLPIEQWIGVEVLNSPVRAGDALDTSIKRVKIRDDCAVSSSRQALDEDGKPYQLPDAVWEGGESVLDTLHLSYPTPSTLPAGRYVLRVYLTYTCPDFVWTTQQPDALFRVVE